jgi:hypothetical protein
MRTAPELVSNNISTTLHEEVYHEVNSNWKLVISRQSSDPKKLTEHVTVPNSQTEVVTSQPNNGTRNI